MDEQPIDVGAAAGDNSGGTGGVDSTDGNGTPEVPQAGSASAPDNGGIPSQNATQDGADAVPATPGEVPDLDSLLEPEDDQNAPPATPQAPEPFNMANLPPELAPLFSASEYVKDLPSAKQAIQAATEMWNVQTGKADAGEMIDMMRQHSPERHAAVVGEIANYLRYLDTNKIADLSKFGISFGQTPDRTNEDPATRQLRETVTKLEQAERQRAEENQRQEYQKQFETRSTAIKGYFESKVEKDSWLKANPSFLTNVLARMDASGVTVDDFNAQLDKGDKADWSAFDKAFKAEKNQTLRMLKDMNKAVIDHSRRLRETTPASPGQGQPLAQPQGTEPNWEQYKADGEKKGETPQQTRDRFSEDYAKFHKMFQYSRQ